MYENKNVCACVKDGIDVYDMEGGFIDRKNTCDVLNNNIVIGTFNGILIWFHISATEQYTLDVGETLLLTVMCAKRNRFHIVLKTINAYIW